MALNAIKPVVTGLFVSDTIIRLNKPEEWIRGRWARGLWDDEDSGRFAEATR